MAQITQALRGSHQYMGKVNGKTFVVPHGKLDIYAKDYYSAHSDDTITSREHVKKHNPGFSDEEIDAVHAHVNKEHQRKLEESMTLDLNEAKEYITSSGEVDHKKVDTQYKRNESQNKHMENAVLLAKHYGTEDEVATAQKHLSDGKKAGHNVHYAENSKLHIDLLNKMRKARGQKEIHEEVETPPIHVRSAYTKAYAKHHMKGRTEARNASYAEVEKKHGPEMTAKLKAFHDHNEQSISEEKDVFAKHQINIAKKTLRMHPAAAAVLGGPDHEESRKILKKHGWSDEQIKKHELSEEVEELNESTDTKLKTITSHVGLSRWFDEVDPVNVGHISAHHMQHIPSPYSHTPANAVYNWKGNNVIVKETKHKHFEIHSVPKEAKIHGTSDEATKEYSEYRKLHEEKKYDIYHKGEYHVSTTQSKTAKEAKEKYLKAYPKHSADDVKVHLSEDIELDEAHQSDYSWHRELQKSDKPLPGHAYHQSSDSELHQVHSFHSKKAIEKTRTDPQAAKRHQEYADNAKQVLDYRKKTMNEEKLSSAEKEKKEEIVKAMKKDKAGFVERYGNRAKEVMYATATKKAKELKENHDSLSVVKELIHEAAFTRRHFRQVADIIKNHPDPKKRHEMASHHAEVFAKSNPRFDKKRFFDAAGVKDHMSEQVEQIDEVSKDTLKSYVTKATADVKNYSYRSGMNDALAAHERLKDHKDSYEKFKSVSKLESDRVKKRVAGIMKAVKKINEASSAETYGARLKSKKGIKKYETGDGKRHVSEKDAMAHADRVHKATGNIISVEKLDEMVLHGHPYHKKSDEELHYIAKDAKEAMEAIGTHDKHAANKYADQMNDALSILNHRYVQKITGKRKG
jgi:hypothetical protein